MKTIQLLFLFSLFTCVNLNFVIGQNVDDCVLKIFDPRHLAVLGQVDEHDDYTFRYRSSMKMLEAYEGKADSIRELISKAKSFEMPEKEILLTLVSLTVNDRSGDAYQYAKNAERSLILDFDKLVAVSYIYELDRKYIKEKRIRDDAVSWAGKLCGFVIEEKKVNSGVHPHELPPVASAAELEFYGLKEHEVIADIGAKLGTFEHSVDTLGKNLTVFVCEMSGLRLDKLTTRLAVSQVMRDNGTTFKCVETAKESFDLPDNALDKAMIRNNFHDFWREEWILFNVKRALKKDGKLFITDIISDDQQSSLSCPNLISRKHLLEVVGGHGFSFVGETKLPNSDRWCFQFSLR